MIRLDHIVVGAKTLEQGVEYVQTILGVEPYGGGKHLKQGTHNKVLRLGDDVYLEVIAPDPASDIKPMWFGLGDEGMLESLHESPRLITYVAQTDDVDSLLEHTRYPLDVQAAQRGNLRWKFGFTADGNVLSDGLLPNLIQWESNHPTQAMKEVGCSLVRLQGFHPEPAAIQQTLQTLGFSDITVQYNAVPKLQAMIQTPSGLKVLS
jgi:Glyoxalase-like domain